MKTVGFGIIGGGLMGREFATAAARWSHLSEVSARPVVVAVADPSEQARTWFTRHDPKIAVYEDYRALLAHPEVEAVYIAVPHRLHEETYLAALRADKHLFAEKPFGIDLPAAEKISSEAKQRPHLLVRVCSEFPFFPAVQRMVKLAEQNAFGRLLEVRAGFLHSSDMDPNKPINWKRQVETNGEYGCMGDLGLHVLHVPLRLGFIPLDVRAILSNIVDERPDGRGGTAACDTWDNATLFCQGPGGVPMTFETKRISPGDTNTWYLQIHGTRLSAEFSTHRPKTLRTMPFTPGQPQAWVEEDLGSISQYPMVTGAIFEFGFADAILQMWAAYLDELGGGTPRFHCATPDEALASHRLFTAALVSHRDQCVVPLTG